MARPIKLPMNPVLAALHEEAEAMGIGFTALLTADIVRYRRIAAAATPALDDWQWELLGHLLGTTEFHLIVSGDDNLPSVGWIIDEIKTWAKDAEPGDAAVAHMLARQVRGWSPAAIAGVLFRLRDEKIADAARAEERRWPTNI